MLHVRTAARLAAFTTELLGLLHQRGEALAGRVAATGRGAAAEFADFLMLQAINRYEPLLAHYAASGDLHPEELFQVCVVGGGGAGDVHRQRRSGRRSFPAYRHERLRESFDPVIAALRESLSKVLVQSAISIPIEPKKFGISVAIVADRSLYGTAVFILAARADLPSEELRRRFPAQLKIGPAEKIGDLVQTAAAGRAGACRCRSRRGRFRITPGSPTSSSIRPTSCGSSSRTPAASRCTSRASSRGWRWSSGRFAAESGLTHGE